MHKHFNKNGTTKKHYDNYSSAFVDCNKHNSKLENLYTLKFQPYVCDICNKIHVGTYYKSKITRKVYEKAKRDKEKIFNKSILIGRIKI